MMILRNGCKLAVVTCALASALSAQIAPARIIGPTEEDKAKQQQQPQQQQPQQQQPARPPQPGAPAAAPAPPTQAAPPSSGIRLTENGGFLLNNVSLTEMIDILAKMMKINYLLDPSVKGAVTIHTYGEVRPVELMPLMETILRVNGATMVKVGDLYHIVPIKMVSQLPLDPLVNADPKTLPDDERMILNLVFLKYATAADLSKLLTPFMGEGATVTTYDPANLMLIEDNSRSMKRTMELIAMFDSDTFAGQRVRLFEVSHSRPSDLVRELDSVFKAYALSDKSSVRFIPVDRINTLIAVAPNPGIFEQVKQWIDKLDIPVKVTAGAVSNYLYRLKYGRAEVVAMAIMALYAGNPMALVGLAASTSAAMYAGGIGLNGTGYGATGVAGGLGGVGGMGYPGAYTYPGAYGGYPGAYGGSAGAYGGGYGYPAAAPVQAPVAVPTTGGGVAAGPAPATPMSPDLTGSYLGGAAYGPQQPGMGMRMPRVAPNPFDNTLLIQASPQEYEQILDLLRQLDVPPRQVLIDAKIYEIDLDNEFSAGVESFLQKRNATTAAGGGSQGLTPSTVLTATTGAGGLALTAGALVLKSHELLALLNTAESRGRSRVISAPSIIATDSIPATMNVGSQVPTLASQGIAGGVQQGGTSIFTNTIANQTSGVTLSITARVNSSGVVTLLINQQVSAPVAPAPSAFIQSPSFTNRSVSTQVTVQDGDTIAIGGIITESRTESSGGVPIIHRIPVLGAVFGAKNYSTTRTELIIFFTPRVIYDTNQLADATDELKGNLKRATKLFKGE